MTRTGWRLGDQVSQFMDPGEREAVRGDLAECGASGWHTFRQVLGLIARRQAGLWADWRPWLAVIAIVLPIGLMLSHATRWWADANAVYISLYLRLWDWSYVGYPGWRRDLALLVWSAATTGIAIAGWSWTSGYLLASLSRRTVWVVTALFVVILFLGTMGTATIARANGDTFAGHFFAVVLPRLIRVGLVLLPILWGMHSYRRASVSRVTISTGAVALIVLTLLTAPFLEASVTLGRGNYPALSVLGPDKTAGTANAGGTVWRVRPRTRFAHIHLPRPVDGQQGA